MALCTHQRQPDPQRHVGQARQHLAQDLGVVDCRHALSGAGQDDCLQPQVRRPSQLLPQCCCAVLGQHWVGAVWVDPGAHLAYHLRAGRWEMWEAWLMW